MSIVRKGAWWTADNYYLARAQLQALDRRTSARTFHRGHLAPIVILPGVYEAWRFMVPMARSLHSVGHPVHVLDALRHNRRPITDSAAVVSQYLSSQQLEGAVIVAHSKGGLIGKQVMAFAPEGWRVRSMVAVATPFNGSSLAKYQPSPTLRAFSPHDKDLRRLDAERAVNERIVSVFPRFDPYIPEGSELAFARNVRINTGGHFRILANHEVLSIVRGVAGQRDDARADQR
jgi:pimeloyl-ACP methyl ester carboxylesterase